MRPNFPEIPDKNGQYGAFGASFCGQWGSFFLLKPTGKVIS
jgi:hypothetical protein